MVSRGILECGVCIHNRYQKDNWRCRTSLTEFMLIMLILKISFDYAWGLAVPFEGEWRFGNWML